MDNRQLIDDVLESAYYGNWTQAKEEYLKLNLSGAEFGDIIRDIIEEGNKEHIKNLIILGYISRGIK